MTSDTDLPTTAAPTGTGRQRLVVALAGCGGVAASAGAAFTFPDPLGGAITAAEAATRLGASGIDTAVGLVGTYVLLGAVVVGALTRALSRDTRPSELPSVPLIPVFGVLHLLLVLAGFSGLAAARAVGIFIFDGVSPAALEAGLVVLNAASFLAQWSGAAFGLAVLVTSLATRRLRGLGVSAGVLGVAMLVPPVGWAVTYLMPLWFAAAGVRLAIVGRDRSPGGTPAPA